MYRRIAEELRTLVQVELVGIARFLPAPPGRAGGRGPPSELIVAGPLSAPGAPALRRYVAAQSAVRIEPAVHRLAVTQ